MERKLAGQSALVTGGNTGIGAAICRSLAEAGANVAINYIEQEDKAEELAGELEKNDVESVIIKGDISQENNVLNMFEFVINQFGTLDILISNAGVEADAPPTEMSISQWNKVIDTNLTGGFLCAREAAREFLRRGVVKKRSRSAGKIIFTGSVHEIIPWGGGANYPASKGGLMLLMKSIAQELAPKKIRVNAIGPGAVKTKINREDWESPEAEESVKKLIPYGRWGVPEDIGPVAAWLASDEADYINGTTIYVDGGMLLYPGMTMI